MTVLGIDAGGTGIRWALYKDEGLIKKGKIDSDMNILSGDLISWEEIFKDILDKVGNVDIVVGAFTGAGELRRKDLIKNNIMNVFRNSKIIIKSDIECLMEFCRVEKPSIIAILGTGSIALSTNGNRVGGWGYLFGDEAGGFSISHEIIKKYFDYIDGIQEYDLIFDTLLKYFRAKNHFELLNILMKKDFKIKIAKFTRFLKKTSLVESVIKKQIHKFSKKVKKLAEKEGIHKIYFYGGMLNIDFYRKTLFEEFEGYDKEICEIKCEEVLAMQGGELF